MKKKKKKKDKPHRSVKRDAKFGASWLHKGSMGRNLYGVVKRRRWLGEKRLGADGTGSFVVRGSKEKGHERRGGIETIK